MLPDVYMHSDALCRVVEFLVEFSFTKVSFIGLFCPLVDQYMCVCSLRNKVGC